MTNTRLFLLATVLLVISCGSPAQVPQPFEGTVTISYAYDPSVPSKWIETLPKSKTVDVSFDPTTGWSEIAIPSMEYAGVTLFSLPVDPPDSIEDYDYRDEPIYTNIGGCKWDWIDDTVYLFKDCTSIPSDTVIPVDVYVSFCEPFEEGLVCRYQGLVVYIGNTHFSFMAQESFSPEYGELVREVAEFYGVNELPNTLEPNFLYIMNQQP